MLAVDHEMLAGIYSTADEERRWVPVLDDLCSRFSVQSAVVQLLVNRPGGLMHVWTGRDTRSLAEADLHDRCLNNPANPRLSPTSSRPPRPIGEIGSDFRLFENDNPQLSRLQQHLSQVGLGHAVWAGFPISEDRHFALLLHRRPDDNRDLDAGEETFLRDLLPHLKQTVRLASTIAASEKRIDALEGALDHFRAGLLLCDRDLNVHWQNKAATQILARSPHLKVAGDHLRASGAAAQAKLRRLVSDTSGAAIGIGDSFDAPLHLRAVALSRDAAAEMWFPGCIALFLSEPGNAPGLDLGELGNLFGLTPAEARLAAALVAGASVNDYAEERGIGLGTARVQMKQVLAKTSTGRQPELVRQLCSSVAASTFSQPS